MAFRPRQGPLLPFVDVHLARARRTDPAFQLVEYGRDYRDYLAGHIPGAAFLPLEAAFAGKPEAGGHLPPAGSMQAFFIEAGIDGSREIVLYDDRGGLWASRACWALTFMGHARARVLDGGLREWLRRGGGLETGPPQRLEGFFELRPKTTMIVDTDWLVARTGDSRVAVLDSRSLGEYVGLLAYARRRGHIPGAIHAHWRSCLEPRRQTLLPRGRLEASFARKGLLDRGLTVVCYCQSGVRSAHTWAVLNMLGFSDARLYEESWGVYGNRPDVPVRFGPFR
jgi:thiosulfate/3-mercaptopyruvate sulfurtransferase